MSLQTIALTVVALLGIPAGMFLKSVTEEEMRPGKKWFKMISTLSVLSFIASIVFLSGNDRNLLLTTCAFIFFISAVPLLKFKK